jgi:hypothetical protein
MALAVKCHVITCWRLGRLKHDPSCDVQKETPALARMLKLSLVLDRSLHAELLQPRGHMLHDR